MLQRTLILLLVLCSPVAPWAAVTTSSARGAGLPGGPTSRAARQDAVRAIPFDKLTDDTKSKLWDVVSESSLYRQMPAQAITSDPRMFIFLVRHPEVIVNIWELMGITHVKMNRTGQYTFDASDGAGTESKLELIYGTNNLHVLYAEGAYEGPLFKKPVRGKCVMVLRTDYKETADETVVTNRFDIFLKVDHLGAELIAKTLHPLVGRAADYNFAESIKFIGKVVEAAERNGPGVQRLATRLTKVDPHMRQEFSDLAAYVHHKSLLRESGEYEVTPARSTPGDETHGEARPAANSRRDSAVSLRR